MRRRSRARRSSRRGRSASWRVELGVDRARRARADVVTSDRARLGVVLGLRDQIGGDPRGIGVAVGDDQHLATAPRSSRCRPRRRPGAWPTRPTRCPARRSCRRAAPSRCRTRARRSPARRRARTRDRRRRAAPRAAPRRDAPGVTITTSRDAGDLRRDRGHQHARRIARGAARHVEPDARERRDAQLEPHAVERRRRRRARAGARGTRGSAAPRARARRAAAARPRRRGASQRVARQLVAAGRRLALVEAARVVGDRGVAARAHVGEDRGDRASTSPTIRVRALEQRPRPRRSSGCRSMLAACHRLPAVAAPQHGRPACRRVMETARLLTSRPRARRSGPCRRRPASPRCSRGARTVEAQTGAMPALWPVDAAQVTAKGRATESASVLVEPDRWTRCAGADRRRARARRRPRTATEPFTASRPAHRRRRLARGDRLRHVDAR